MYVFSITDLSTNVFSHTKSAEQIDADTTISSQEDLVLKNCPTHQDNGSQIGIISLNQGVPRLLEGSITLLSEVAKSDNHTEGERILSQKNPKVSQVREGVILNEGYFSNPLGQLLFTDPFFVSLEAFKEGIKHAKNSLWWSLKKIWSTTVRKQVRGKWHFHFFNVIKELNQDQPCNHLLDWLYWKEEFTK